MGSSHDRVPNGETEWGSFYRGLSETDEREFWKRSVFLSMGVLRGETGRRASLPGTLKDSSRKALETGISLHRGPFGELGGGFIYRGI